MWISHVMYIATQSTDPLSLTSNFKLNVTKYNKIIAWKCIFKMTSVRAPYKTEKNKKSLLMYKFLKSRNAFLW